MSEIKDLIFDWQKKIDPVTALHARNVAYIALTIGSRCGLDKEQLQNLFIGALLHDIGKAGLPRPCREMDRLFNQEEKKLVQIHTLLGYRLLCDLGFPNTIAEVALFHHEWYNGGGYPFRLRGNQIPILARIVSIADSYEVLVNGRPYQERRSSLDASLELAGCSGRQFEPRLLKLLFRMEAAAIPDT